MNIRTINLIVVHCSATPPHLNWGAKDIDYLHRRQNGWSSIGYHWVIRRDGCVEKGRNENLPGAHVRGYNLHSIGVCLVGGLDERGMPANNFTPKQFKSLRGVLEVLRFNYSDTRICGHRDLSPDLDGDGTVEANEWIKACPCFDVAEWCRLNQINPTKG